MDERDSFIAVKAVGDWELDINFLPWRMDSDGQWFDPATDIMEHKFSAPLIVYQHGVAQGAKALDEKPVLLGDPVPGSLSRQADGWHIKVILDKSVKLAASIMEAAKRGLVAVSSGSVSHLARLDIGGKLHMYDKTKPGRIAVWPVAEISLWEMGNGNLQPANKYAYALPAMKAIYREVSKTFPDIDTGGATQAEEVRKRARIEQDKAEKFIYGEH